MRTSVVSPRTNEHVYEVRTVQLVRLRRQTSYVHARGDTALAAYRCTSRRRSRLLGRCVYRSCHCVSAKEIVCTAVRSRRDGVSVAASCALAEDAHAVAFSRVCGAYSPLRDALTGLYTRRYEPRRHVRASAWCPYRTLPLCALEPAPHRRSGAYMDTAARQCEQAPSARAYGHIRQWHQFHIHQLPLLRRCVEYAPPPSRPAPALDCGGAQIRASHPPGHRGCWLRALEMQPAYARAQKHAPAQRLYLVSPKPARRVRPIRIR